MTKHLTKLLLLAFLLVLPKIGSTNSFFTSQVNVNNNVISIGCWTTPSIPSSTDPTNNSFSNSSNQTLTWNPSVNTCPIATVSYYYEVSKNSDFSQPIFSNTISNISVGLTGLNDGKYYWRVRALDQFGNQSNFSNTFSFIIDTVIPSSRITIPLLNIRQDNDIYTIKEVIKFWNKEIHGVASDQLSGAGVKEVKLSIHYIGENIFNDLNKFWNGTNWVNGTESSVRVTADGTTDWEYKIKGSISSGFYQITSHAVDNANNIENSDIIKFEYLESPPCRPDVQLNTTNGSVSFTATCISDHSKLNYKLTYLSDDLEKGLDGSIDINNKSEVSHEEILGSRSCDEDYCSYHYDPNISHLKLKVDLTSKTGQVTTIIKELP